MNKKIVLLLVLPLMILASLPVLAQNNYRYYINIDSAAGDQLKVTLLTPKIKTVSAIFYMPKILPGTYTNSDFGKFITSIKAFDKAGKALPVKAQADSNSWKISGAAKLYKLVYTVQDSWDAAFKHGVYEMAGTNFETGKNFVLNTCGIFGYFDGLKKIPFDLNITRPAAFYASTGLVPVSSTANTDVFRCNNADHLYDSPIMLCVPDTTLMKIGNTDVLVSVYAPKKMVTSKYVAENLHALLEATKNYLGGKLPVNKYAFIYYFNSEQPTVQGQGAWEHSYSSFYALPEFPQEKFISTIVDVSSHEFFHVVTPLNICSKEVREFNFNKTILSKHLWLYEGSTEYDAHHTQVTQGLITPEEYLKRLSLKIKTSKNNYNDTLAFTELSLGSAGKYEDQYANVYQKGALIAACLDLYLNKLSGGNYGLKNLKHDLSVRYGPNNYFIDDELFDEITSLTFPEVRIFFRRYVEGSEALPYDSFFAMAGVKYIPVRETNAIGLGGFSAQPNEQGIMVVGSIAKLTEFGKKMGYQKGDELISLNGEELSPVSFAATTKKFLSAANEGDTVRVQVKRKNAAGESQALTLSAPAVKSLKKEEHVLEMDTPNEEQFLIRKAWLNLPCKK